MKKSEEVKKKYIPKKWTKNYNFKENLFYWCKFCSDQGGRQAKKHIFFEKSLYAYHLIGKIFILRNHQFEISPPTHPNVSIRQHSKSTQSPTSLGKNSTHTQCVSKMSAFLRSPKVPTYLKIDKKWLRNIKMFPKPARDRPQTT